MTEYAAYIDHTQLKPDTTQEKIDQIIDEARIHGFKSVCVNPYWVHYCSEELAGSNVLVCTVIGFPLGASSTKVKVFEAKQAMEDGADELDMVINVGELKSNHPDIVQKDIQAVVDMAAGNALVKVIIETSLLTEEEKIKACQLARAAGADYVKTSTGFSGGGATTKDIQLMRETVGEKMGVKASGGVRDAETAKAMIDHGATRIGASSGVQIVAGLSGDSDY